MTRRYRATDRARQDLVQIARYTGNRWGKARRETYLRALEQRFEWLAANPQLGHKRDEIERGYRCFPEGSHLIFYLIDGEHIDIIGIAHRSMDIDRFFERKVRA